MTDESKKPYAQMLREGRTKEHERKPVQASTLRVWSKCGRYSMSFAWMAFLGDFWRDQGPGLPEVMRICFDPERLPSVTVTGFHLKSLLATLDEGGLQVIREHDSQEIELLRHENEQSKREPSPIILRIMVGRQPLVEAVRNSCPGRRAAKELDEGNEPDGDKPDDDETYDLADVEDEEEES